MSVSTVQAQQPVDTNAFKKSDAQKKELKLAKKQHKKFGNTILKK